MTKTQAPLSDEELEEMIQNDVLCTENLKSILTELRIARKARGKVRDALHEIADSSTARYRTREEMDKLPRHYGEVVRECLDSSDVKAWLQDA